MFGVNGGGQLQRELSPIKDQDGDQNGMNLQNGFDYTDADLSTTYLTPPSSTNLSSTSPTDSFRPDTASTGFDFDPSQQPPYTPNGPLPIPTFSFGTNPSVMTRPLQMSDEQAAMLMEMQNRGRMDSMPSVNTFTIEGTNTAADGSEWPGDWGFALDRLAPDGFDPDIRRASA